MAAPQMATAPRGPVDTLAAPQRQIGSAGKKWSEVCGSVQHSDGSVRTPAVFKQGGATSAVSPPRPRLTPSHTVGVRRPGGAAVAAGGSGSSLGGSSRGGSSGKSSRSSSRDIAHDGDVSSRCSSGCWETSSGSSRPRSPPDPVCGPTRSGTKGLLMPDPMRPGVMLSPALLDDPTGEAESKLDQQATTPFDSSCASGITALETCVELPNENAHHQPGALMKADPFGRDVPRHGQVKADWSVEPLIKYLKKVLKTVDTNLRDKRLPTTEKLDAFVSRLVRQTSRIVERAPKKVRSNLRAVISRSFNRFWNFVRNEKVRVPTPEELHRALSQLIDSLADFLASPEPLAQPNIVRQPSPHHARFLDAA